MSGEFTEMNKRRNGVYFNIQTVLRNVANANMVGVTAMSLPLNWGDAVVRVDASDISTNRVLEKLGVDSSDESLLPILLALENCREVFVYRADKGGSKATLSSEDNIGVTAKYEGTFGNNIQIEIVKAADSKLFNVITYVNGRSRNRQVVKSATELKSNDFVVFDTLGTIAPLSAKPLVGGANGTVAAGVTDFLNSLTATDIDVIAVFGVEGAKEVIDYIDKSKANYGKDIRAVIEGYEHNHSHTRKLKPQGFKRDNGLEVKGDLYVAYMAGLEAGSTGSIDNTNREIIGAKEIINPIHLDEIDEAVRGGFSILTARSDGTIILEQDVNSLENFGDDLSEMLQSGRNNRIVIEIKNAITAMFEKYIIGKVNGKDSALEGIRSFLITLLGDKAKAGVIEDFNPETDLDVRFGNSRKEVVIDLAIENAVSIEKIYIYMTQVV